MPQYLQSIHGALWGAPALMMILGVGMYLSIRTEFAQIRLFPHALREFYRKLRSRRVSDGEISPFQALCTALAATVGTGNLVGVAGAICLGGPGAVFWMWLCGIAGMITKFAEVTLAVRYRQGSGGHFFGGPMYIISEGMGSRWKWLAGCYSFFGILAAFGVGNAVQVNAVISGINGIASRYGGPVSATKDLAMGLILAVAVGAMLLGGAKCIGQAAEKLVPFASAAYLLLCTAALLRNRSAIPDALLSILQGAFCPRAATCGFIGSAFQALKIGCSRGVFTNEAGMGTASIAHASAAVQHPVEQGLMGIVEVFLDTIVICTMTALVILTAGVPIPYGTDAGGELTLAAFTGTFGDWTSVFITAALCCFAFATILGWGLYGCRCSQYLFGQKAWGVFALLQTAAVVLGSVTDTRTVWLLAETANGLMAIPNLIALAALAPELVRLTIEYKTKSDKSCVSGGNYANFHQCKSLRTLSYEKIPSSGGGSKKGR